jgi:hypothetical protein
MDFEERLQKAENNGYTPVYIHGENAVFFVENSRKPKIGELIKDGLGDFFNVRHIQNDGRIVSTRVFNN